MSSSQNLVGSVAASQICVFTRSRSGGCWKIPAEKWQRQGKHLRVSQNNVTPNYANFDGKMMMEHQVWEVPPFFWGADMGFIYHPPQKKNNAVLSENDDNPSECGRLNDHPIWCPMPASSDKRSKSSSSSNGQSRMSKAKSCGRFSVQRCSDQAFNAIQLMVGLQFMRVHGKILAANPVFSNLNDWFPVLSVNVPFSLQPILG